VPAGWPTWTLWQYTDGAYGPQPYEVAGVGRCDRDMFNGDEAQLQALWGAHSGDRERRFRAMVSARSAGS
jgi:lysozyme